MEAGVEGVDKGNRTVGLLERDGHCVPERKKQRGYRKCDQSSENMQIKQYYKDFASMINNIWGYASVT